VATIVAALERAELAGMRLRVLITAQTWTAVDNVLKPLHAEAIRRMRGRVRIARLASAANVPELPDYPDILLPIDHYAPSADVMALLEALRDDAPGLFVVGATSHQVHNSIRVDTDNGVAPLFDLAVIDEGSQLDMANAIVSLAALADGASVICAGDPFQLPPTIQAEPPRNLANMVGSIYLFLKHHHGIEESELQINYRSNATIVEFCRQAGYDRRLRSHSENLRLRLDSQGGDGGHPDPGWPAG
jgi:hypothetical protein